MKITGDRHRAAVKITESCLAPAVKFSGWPRVQWIDNSFHDLRHSFASQLIAAGRSIKEVQELLGHASIQTTMRYAHLAPERMRDAVASLDDA